MDTEGKKPSVLFVYYTYTNQTKKVLDTISEVLRDHDSEVTFARVELTTLATRSDSSRSR